MPVVAITGCYTWYADTKTMRIPRMRTKKGQKAFSYRGPKIWSLLPGHARQISKFMEFKQYISIHITTLFENHPT